MPSVSLPAAKNSPSRQHGNEARESSRPLTLRRCCSQFSYEATSQTVRISKWCEMLCSETQGSCKLDGGTPFASALRMPSFLPECGHRIDFGRVACRSVAGENRDHDEQSGNT